MSFVRRIAVGSVLAAALGLTTIGLSADVQRGRDDDHDNDNDRSASRIQRGFELAPVRLDLRHKNPAAVGLGSYIVNAQGGCNDCHTCPPYTAEHDPYSGGDGRPNAANYLAGGTPFGPFVSRNITPNATASRRGSRARSSSSSCAPGTIPRIREGCFRSCPGRSMGAC
jgi:hypothetical protein